VVTFTRDVLGVPLQDITGGFKGWRKEVLLKLGVSDYAREGMRFR